jgi:hypothetical protein
MPMARFSTLLNGAEILRMALLVACLACDRSVSAAARSCPRCGHPRDPDIEQPFAPQSGKNVASLKIVRKRGKTDAFERFTVLSGDFSHRQDVHHVSRAVLRLKGKSFFSGFEEVPTSRIASIQVVNENSGKSFAGSAIAGVGGALLLGGIGAIAGVLSGGNSKTTTFVLALRDGRQVLCRAQSKAFEILQTVAFENASGAEIVDAQAVDRSKTYLTVLLFLFAALIAAGYGSGLLDQPESLGR